MEQYPGQAVQTHRRIVIEGTSSDKVLTDGKGKMPAFGKKLKPDDIAQLVAYIRALPKK